MTSKNIEHQYNIRFWQDKMSQVPRKPQPYFHPGLIQRTTGRLTKIFRNITIEPAMFLISFSSAIDQIATSQLVVLKSCKLDFGYNDTVCENINSPIYDAQNIEVSNEVSKYLLLTIYLCIFHSFCNCLYSWISSMCIQHWFPQYFLCSLLFTLVPGQTCLVGSLCSIWFFQLTLCNKALFWYVLISWTPKKNTCCYL